MDFSNLPPVVNEGMGQPGGLSFTDRGIRLPLKGGANNLNHLIQLIERFRATNNFPPGNPRQEYTDWLCSTWPERCHNTKKNNVIPPPSAPDQSQVFLTRVMSFLQRMTMVAAKDSNYVTQEVANKRAAICLNCPNNQFITGCQPCKNKVEQVTLKITKGKQPQIQRDGKLGSCMVIGQENNAACFLKKSVLPLIEEHIKAKLPSYCWRLTPDD